MKVLKCERLYEMNQQVCDKARIERLNACACPINRHNRQECEYSSSSRGLPGTEKLRENARSDHHPSIHRPNPYKEAIFQRNKKNQKTKEPEDRKKHNQDIKRRRIQTTKQKKKQKRKGRGHSNSANFPLTNLSTSCLTNSGATSASTVIASHSPFGSSRSFNCDCTILLFM